MKKPILVTGAHRSGSTWIGKIIAKANQVRYVSEPFNVSDYKNGIPFKQWFYFVDNNSASYQQLEVRKYIDSFSNFSARALIRDFSQIRSFKTLKKVINDYQQRSTHRTLFKDPIAFFSAEWLAEHYLCDVVISVRHPAAFIASLKVKNWQFNFNNFLEQKELMETHLLDYKTEIEQYAINRPDIIKQGILLWNIIYALVLKYQTTYNNKWYVVTHESLSLNPVEEFEKIFNYLNLDFTNAVKNELLESTTANENTKLKRNAKENILAWKNRLTPDEVLLIKNETAAVWPQFYDEASWG